MHTYTSVALHVVFATKERRRSLTPEIRDHLFPYLGGIVRDQGGFPITIGGIEDHVHALFEISAVAPISTILRELKGSSSRWINENWPRKGFAWQRGYGAFSVSRSNRDAVIRYIERQEEHHKHLTFEEEYIELLKAHGIAFESKWLWA
ncbi:MAG: IS200/IS605 family transposase [Thermoanaerobaculia bacterium]|jgi:REP element-mobilizing transposase RayT